MLATNTLGDLLATLLDRRPFGKKIEDGRKIRELCLALLTETDETSGRRLTATILNRYGMLDRDQKVTFFEFLNDELDLDATRIAELAEAYGSDPSPENFQALSRASEPRRQALFRQMNEAPGATAEIVRLRRDLLTLLDERPELGRTDHDIVHLLRSWFNRGFLVVSRSTGKARPRSWRRSSPMRPCTKSAPGTTCAAACSRRIGAALRSSTPRCRTSR